MNYPFPPFPDDSKGHLIRLLAASDNIVITTHTRPDGDAAGSTLALWNYLHRIGKQATVIFSDPLDTYISWLPGSGQSLVASAHPEEAKKLIEKADLIFCLDYGVVTRTGDFLSALIYASNAPRVLMDHHLWPEMGYSLSFHHDKASSTCEIIYRVILTLGDEKLIDREIAECLYTGIVTDTGSFRLIQPARPCTRQLPH